MIARAALLAMILAPGHAAAQSARDHELRRAFGIVRDEALAIVPEAELARRAAAAMGGDAAAAVVDEAGLLAHFARLTRADPSSEDALVARAVAALVEATGQPGEVYDRDAIRKLAEPDPATVAARPPAVEWRMAGAVGVVTLRRFDHDTERLFREGFAAIRRSTPSLKGLVVDLRGNEGGLLDGAIRVADLLLDKGVIGAQHGRTATDVERHEARRGDVAGGVPLAVLVDGRTAAGAEIVAAALQENRRARLLGRRTFGRGTVQTLLAAGPELMLRITTNQFMTAAGRKLDGVGVVPDVAVEDASGPADAVLDRALAELPGPPA